MFVVTNWRINVTATLNIDVYRITKSLQDIIISHTIHHCIQEHDGETKASTLTEQKERRIERRTIEGEADMSSIFS
jgi:hypothetical protein